jgi:hypothetical protein
MPTVLDTTGLDRLRARFDRLANPDPAPLLVRVADLMDEDNRRGVLAGEDKDGSYMLAVTYRPRKPGAPSVKLTVAQRLGQRGNIKRGKYSRIGSGLERANNNLTSAEYRLLDGPPLAPRRQFSRVITNYMQSSGQIGPRVWEVIGAWVNVVNAKGQPFLKYHFNGEGRLPVRDLRGIRPPGMTKIRAAIRAWMTSEVRSSAP